MKEYKREYPLFSLCGLNCGLCPRYHTNGTSKCPGCGGQDFESKHPACKVITCNKKHDDVQYCYECSLYPCDKYTATNNLDSFITYKNVNSDLEKLKKYGLDNYKKELNEKVNILQFILANYDDGRHKNFYCLAVNLLSLESLQRVINSIKQFFIEKKMDKKECIDELVLLLNKEAENQNLKLELRR